MQANLDRRKAASGARSARLFVAILAGVPLLAALALSSPDRALAACGASRPAGVHASSSGGGVHAATGTPSSGGAAGGGSGSLGCANGSSASALHGLATTASGRVVERGAHPGVRTAVHARTAATRSTNPSGHLHAVRPSHRV
jgi:hypothetical protein